MSATDSASMEDLDAVNRRVDDMERKFKEAFPGGDYAGHCRYHEVQIQMLLDRRKLIAAIQEKTIGGIVFAVVVAVGLAIWQWFKEEIKK